MQKRTIVLLRGLGHEARHWGEFSEKLAKQDFCKQLILCDLPGAGVHHREAGYASVPEILKNIVDRYHEGMLSHKPLTLFGLSLGGMLSLEWLSTYPDLFSEYFILNASVGSLSPYYERMKFSAVPKILKIASKRKTVERERLILALTAHLRRNDETILKQHVHIMESAPIRFPTLVKQLFAAVRYQGPKHLIKTPGLVLYSKHDDLVDSRCSVALAQHLSADAIVHETAGHDLTLDDPDWVIARMREFYEKRGDVP
jgi:pimeloyl-ACP methyl ester carboxylesterase